MSYDAFNPACIESKQSTHTRHPPAKHIPPSCVREPQLFTRSHRSHRRSRPPRSCPGPRCRRAPPPPPAAKGQAPVKTLARAKVQGCAVELKHLNSRESCLQVHRARPPPALCTANRQAGVSRCNLDNKHPVQCTLDPVFAVLHTTYIRYRYGALTHNPLMSSQHTPLTLPLPLACFARGTSSLSASLLSTCKSRKVSIIQVPDILQTAGSAYTMGLHHNEYPYSRRCSRTCHTQEEMQYAGRQYQLNEVGKDGSGLSVRTESVKRLPRPPRPSCRCAQRIWTACEMAPVECAGTWVQGYLSCTRSIQ